MKRVTVLIISIVLLILTIIFALQNAALIEIDYFFWHGKISLSLILFLTLGLSIFIATAILVPIIVYKNSAKDSNSSKKGS